MGALVFTALVVLALSTTVQTARYAVYHDELWNHPAAVSLLQGTSWRRGWEVPVFGVPLPLVSGPYQGSLKTFLLTPLLAVFGTSPAALRGIHCAFGLLYLAALYWALRAVLARRPAALVFLLPLADPNLAMFVPTDQGPFLLQNALFALSLGALLRLASGRELRWVLLALGAASLALADKLTGLPLAAVLMLLALILGGGVLLRRRRYLALAALAVALPLLPHAAYFAAAGFSELEENVGRGMSQKPPYLVSLGQTLHALTGHIADGSAMPKSLTGHSPPPHRPLLAPLALALAAGGGAVALWRRGTITAPVGVATLSLALGLLAYAAVPGLTRPWHYFQLQPPLVVAASLGLGALLQQVPTTSKVAIPVRALAALAVAAAAGVGALRTGQLLSFLSSHQGTRIYSPGLYELQRKVFSLAPQRLVCLNYSLCNPLYVLARGRVEVVDLTWAELSETTEGYVRHLLSLPGTVLVYRQVSGARGPAQASYFDWLNRTSDWLLPRLEGAGGPRREQVHSDGRVEFGLLRAPSTPTP